METLAHLKLNHPRHHPGHNKNLDCTESVWQPGTHTAGWEVGGLCLGCAG